MKGDLKRITSLINHTSGLEVFLKGKEDIFQTFLCELTVLYRPNKVSLKGVYTNWESFHFQDDLGEGKHLLYSLTWLILTLILALCEIVESVPFGVLCFLPSYNTLDKLIQRWKVTNINTFTCFHILNSLFS